MKPVSDTTATVKHSESQWVDRYQAQLEQAWNLFEASHSLLAEKMLNLKAEMSLLPVGQEGAKRKLNFTFTTIENFFSALIYDLGLGVLRNPEKAKFYLQNTLGIANYSLDNNCGFTAAEKLAVGRAFYLSARWLQRDGRQTLDERAKVKDALQQSVFFNYRPAMSALAQLMLAEAREESGEAAIPPSKQAEITRLLQRALPDAQAYYLLALLQAPDAPQQAYAYMQQAAQSGYEPALREYATWSFHGNCTQGPIAVFDANYAQVYWATQQLERRTAEELSRLEKIVPDKLPKANSASAAQLAKLMLLSKGPFEHAKYKALTVDDFQDFARHKDILMIEINKVLANSTPEQAFKLLHALIQPTTEAGDRAITSLNRDDKQEVDTQKRTISLLYVNLPGSAYGQRVVYEDDEDASKAQTYEEKLAAAGIGDDIRKMAEVFESFSKEQANCNYYFLLRSILHHLRGILLKGDEATTLTSLKSLHEVYARQHCLHKALHRPAEKLIPICAATEVEANADDEVAFMPANVIAEVAVHAKMVLAGDFHLCIELNNLPLLKKLLAIKPLPFAVPEQGYPVPAFREIACHALEYALQKQHFAALACMVLAVVTGSDPQAKEHLTAWLQEVASSKKGRETLEALAKALLLEVRQNDFLSALQRASLPAALNNLLSKKDQADDKAVSFNSVLIEQFVKTLLVPVVDPIKENTLDVQELLQDLLMGNQQLVFKIGALHLNNKCQLVKVPDSNQYYPSEAVEDVPGAVLRARQFLLGIGQPCSLLTATHWLEQVIAMTAKTEAEIHMQLMLIWEMARIYQQGLLGKPNPALAIHYWTALLQILAGQKALIPEQPFLSCSIHARQMLKELLGQQKITPRIEDIPQYALWLSFGVYQAPALMNACYTQLFHTNDHTFRTLYTDEERLIRHCVGIGGTALPWERYRANYACIVSNNVAALQALIKAGACSSSEVCETPVAKEHASLTHLIMLADVFASANGIHDYRVLTLLFASLPSEGFTLPVVQRMQALAPQLGATAATLGLDVDTFQAKLEQLKAREAELKTPVSAGQLSLLPAPRVQTGVLPTGEVGAVPEAKK